MNLREAAQMALDSLDQLNEGGWILADFEDEVYGAIEALRAALAQPEPEPVAVVTGVYGGRFVVEPINKSMVLPIHMTLYAAPPQRGWIGLTDEDIACIVETYFDDAFMLIEDVACAVEAKLKGKNSD